MNLQKHLLLVVGGAIALLLIVAATYFLLRFRSEYVSVRSDLAASDQRLEQLHRRDPFPSEANVEMVRKNAERLKGFYGALGKFLLRGQVATASMEPAEFRQMLENSVAGPDGLRNRAKLANVALPERFAFGFDRYEQGALPRADFIPRLVIQLRTVEQLCKLLYDARISELVSIARETFDEAPLQTEGAVDVDPRMARRMPRGQPAAAPQAPSGSEEESSLFSSETITLTFLARENALWAVLDELGRTALPVMVKNVTITNERATAAGRPGPQPGPPGARAPGQTSAPRSPGAGMPPAGESTGEEAIPSHDERVVAGNERVLAEITLEVFRFKEAPEPVAGGDA